MEEWALGFWTLRLKIVVTELAPFFLFPLRTERLVSEWAKETDP